MSGPKRATVALLAAGLVLAVGTPAFLGYTAQHLEAGQLRRHELWAWQTLPYLACAALWLPWRSASVEHAGRVVAAILLAVSVALYVPMLLHPAWLAGDMVGLAFFAVTLAFMGGVIAVSAIAWVVLRLRRPRPGAL